MIRMRQILCPIDFSNFSRHAFDYAVRIARAHDATVIAIHVFPAQSAVPTAAVPFGPEGPGPLALPEVDRQGLARHLELFLAGDGASDVRTEYLVVEAPSVTREILVQAERVEADLIVLGTHGRSGFERLLLGSTTEKLLRRASIPVLTVPSRAADGPPPASFTNVLCALDFSASSLAGLEYASSLAAPGASRLTVLHVVELLPVVYEPTIGTAFDVERDRPALMQAGLDRLRRTVGEPLRKQHDVEEVVASGKPYVEILKAAAARSADLIVLGVHGHNVVDRMMFGSTGAHVVRAAACPVLTVREARSSA
jgi:nucleotide-binding universal stress UspA family protein